jgi:hypothetical protein
MRVFGTRYCLAEVFRRFRLPSLPAQAGIHLPATHWIPAYAGMTDWELPLK